MTLEAKYNHLAVENDKYQNWIEKGYFTAGDLSKRPYCIVIPPPNVTGKLHLGHAWDTTLQDILCRYKRLKGYDVCWVAGMDHAGIATQAKVDARLKSEGISRYDIGREKFLERAWEWKEEYASTIRSQWAKLGLSLDYSRERFTLDEGLSQAVRKVFVDLYNDGLIYQGERIINWDPEAKTALSNIEVEHKEIMGHMYYFKYKVVETGQELVIATTRPETMFADQAIFVHPDDERYKDIVGMHAINPANGDKLPIMADDYIDMSFGTAVMKCTPAHDPNDFALAKKYNLPMPICMNPDGTMNDMCGKYAGMDRFECREALVNDFKEAGVVDHIEEHLHQVGHSERTGVIVEPYLSKQWFVKMKPLAEEVLKNQEIEDQRINFVPPRFNKTFEQWLENIEDWCISRQLWWGHRIPAYYCDECGEVVVARETPEVCPKCGCKHFTQDEDTLDTWFSSALWPFSTLGWPEKTKELDYFYPTNTLVTGYDIIFFWVVRMVFSGYEQTGKSPFDTVLIHGLVRDEQGRKMSKSLGNGINPLDVIAQYGADALRFTLITGNAPGNDMRYTEKRVIASRNFANKIWNASRFIMMNLEQADFSDVTLEDLTSADKWILSKLNTLAKDVTDNMEKYELGIAVQKLNDFLWEEFCDWYIEMVKPRLYNDEDQTKAAALWTLNTVLTEALKLLHPYMPFITEEIYCNLTDEESIMLAKWPEFKEEWNFKADEKAVETIKEAVRGIRNVRAEMNVSPKKKAQVYVVSEDAEIRDIFEQGKVFFATLGYASEVIIQDNKDGIGDDAVSSVIAGAVIYMPFAELVDIAKEKERLAKEEKRLNGEIKRCEGMLGNERFVSKAPEAKVQEEKDKLAKYQQMLEQVKEQIARIS